VPGCFVSRYWLFKTEPDTFSWADLLKAPGRRTAWEGVRNYQARNLMRDEMKAGDGVLFYHSRVVPQVVMGTAKIVREAYPDATQFDPESPYYDPGANPAQPRWLMVDVAAVQAFKEPLSRDLLKTQSELADMMLLKKGARLSVQPVSEHAWRVIARLGEGVPLPS
jgi:predicted RNA-binding protein with PUA-like domain